MEIRKAIFNRTDLMNWLYEYSCQTCEWEGINPHLAAGYVQSLMLKKANSIYKVVEFVYKNKDENSNLVMDYSVIEDIVRKEHGGGKSIPN